MIDWLIGMFCIRPLGADILRIGDRFGSIADTLPPLRACAPRLGWYPVCVCVCVFVCVCVCVRVCMALC